jgi:heat shock protein HslJ
MRFATLFFISVMTISLLPTASAQSPEDSSLSGTRWQLVAFGDTAIEFGTVTLEFVNETDVNGSGGCNSYGGTYETDGDAIAFSEIISTLIACEDAAIMEQEQSYFDALELAERFELDENELTIFYGDGQQLRFEQLSPLFGTRWILQSYGMPDQDMPIVPGSSVTLEFQLGGQAAGRGGCNSYGTTYEAIEDALSFGAVVATDVACVDSGIMEQEIMFFEALQSATRFEMAEEQLIILLGEDSRLIFVPASELVGSSWQLASFSNPSEKIPVIADSTVTLEFQLDDQAGGSGGCNRYGTTYSVMDDALTFGEIETTEMGCGEEGIMEQEQMFYNALRSSSRFEINGDHLTIWYGEESRLNFTQSGVVSSPQLGSESETLPDTRTSSSESDIVPQLFENPDSPVSLLASYYNAINRGEYERAYSYWETPQETLEAFTGGFADTASVQVLVEPPTHYEGAAGSVYVSIPTVLIAQHNDSSKHMFAGCFVARKSNLSPPDVPEEPIWYLYSADISEVANDADIPTLLQGGCLGE